MKVNQLFCPECEYLVKVGARPFKGQRLQCTECGAQLTVVNLSPLELEVSTKQKQTNTKNKMRLVEVACPECDGLIKLKARLREGEGLVCPECGADLTVINTDPLELDIALPVNIKGIRPSRKPGKHKS